MTAQVPRFIATFGSNGFNPSVLLALIILTTVKPGAFAADPAAQPGVSAGARETVQQMFHSDQSFRVAQAATVPISVVHAASFTPFEGAAALASNTFGTVFGQTGDSAVAQESGRLLPDVAINDWADDFVDGVAPTSLSGVRVLVNGRESFISFIGRAEDLGTTLDQINFVAPDDDALGPVSIEVFQGDQMVAASVVNRGPLSPGLFAFGVFEGVTLPAAVSALGEFIAPVGFFAGLDTRPARSGETILMFGTGFGATEPSIPAGQIVTQLSQIPTDEIMITIGGLPAIVQFAGLAPNLTGLHQFNLVVPQLPNGIHAVTIERAGVRSQDGTSIPVDNQ